MEMSTWYLVILYIGNVRNTCPLLFLALLEFLLAQARGTLSLFPACCASSIFESYLWIFSKHQTVAWTRAPVCEQFSAAPGTADNQKILESGRHPSMSVSLRVFESLQYMQAQAHVPSVHDTIWPWLWVVCSFVSARMFVCIKFIVERAQSSGVDPRLATACMKRWSSMRNQRTVQQDRRERGGKRER